MVWRVIVPFGDTEYDGDGMFGGGTYYVLTGVSRL